MKSKVLLLVGLLSFALSSFACSCIGRPTVKESVKKSDVILVGRVISEERVLIGDTTEAYNKYGGYFEDSLKSFLGSRNGFYKLFDVGVRPQKRFYLKLIQYYKGEFVSDTISLLTGNGGGDCGIRFKKGQEYIIYGYVMNFQKEQLNYFSSGLEKEMITTHVCTRTQVLKNEELYQIERFRKLRFFEN